MPWRAQEAQRAPAGRRAAGRERRGRAARQRAWTPSPSDHRDYPAPPMSDSWPSGCSTATSARWRAGSRWSRTTTPTAGRWSRRSTRTPATPRSSASPARPGAGKSTLIGALIRHQRKLDRQVAVLSIDPSSPFRGGALLGDRIRLTEHFLDPGVFIRSMATRGALGGLAEAALQTALLMDAAGKDDVFLETVGVGQAEVDVIDHADSVVLVLIPGSGDSIQALKAGVMEIPDIIVVNKSDHPLTDTMVREIRGVLVAGAAGGLAGADRQDRGGARRGRREARREARRAPRARRGRGHAVRAPAPQPDERGARDRDDAAAPRAGGVACARTRRCRSCSTRSSRAGWIRRARRARCSPAARSTRARPRAPTWRAVRHDHSSSSRCNTPRRSLQSRHAEGDRGVRLRRACSRRRPPLPARPR